MAKYLYIVILNTLLLILPKAVSDYNVPVPADNAKVQGWFNRHVKPLAERKGTLNPALEAAEAEPVRVVRVMKDGSGDFTTIGKALNSIPSNNEKRVVVFIGHGEYAEKIKIERDKKFITFLGDPANMPTLVYNGNAATFTIVESGTLTVESDYFVAANLHIKNSSPRPNRSIKGAQAAAMRIGGDMAAFYNVRFYGYQDTFCDDRGKHFFKDCYIEGTIDFIFGNARSLYLNTEIFCIPGELESWITAQARNRADSDTGYVFVHCTVTGNGQGSFLGRAWKPYSRVIYAYSELSNVVNPRGWNSNNQGAPETNLFFGELGNTGPGADMSLRESFVRKLSKADAKPFINLAYIEACKWLLPPPKV